MAASRRASPGTPRSRKTSPRKSSGDSNRHVAKVGRDGRWYILTFSDGEMTQARTRLEALHMAADLRACLDDRLSTNYYAKWHGDDVISVVVVP